jgi:glycerol-3-phosphate dehydrogenase
MARSLGVRTPITDAMYDILYNGKHPSVALQELMVRDLREETVKD